MSVEGGRKRYSTCLFWVVAGRDSQRGGTTECSKKL
jgi:hypothetical protein